MLCKEIMARLWRDYGAIKGGKGKKLEDEIWGYEVCITKFDGFWSRLLEVGDLGRKEFNILKKLHICI